MVPYLRAANVKDGALDLTDVKEMNFTPQEQNVFALRLGDVLVTEGAGSLAAVGAAAVWNGELPGTVCFQNTLLRLRPRPGIRGRFLAWWARHAYADNEFASIATGVNIYHLSADRVRTLPARFPSETEQVRIADYLDAETSRINVLVAKKRQMIEILQERFAAFADEVIWTGVRCCPLMYRTDQRRPIMYGIVLPGPDVPVGVAIVKGGDVAQRRLSLDELNKTTFEIEAPYARARLKAGDLVFAIRGGIGDVEIVPSEIAGANITQDVARVAPAASVDPEWLRFALLTRTAQADVERRVTGATIKGLNIRELKRVAVPSSDADRQGTDLKRLMPEAERVGSLVRALSSQIQLLQEHRQALITAAVTGDPGVPGITA
jgi:type I restriction enzyme S subunit